MEPVTDDPERPWYEPGVHRVAPEVYRIPLPMPGDGLKAVNAYALTQPDGLRVIDPGVGAEDAQVALQRALGGLGAGTVDIQEVLVTHVHYDHYAQAILLRRRHGMRVGLGRHEEASVDVLGQPEGPQTTRRKQLRRFGSEKLAKMAADQRRNSETDGLLAEHPDHWIEDQQVVAGGSLVALHTPGHTVGHVVFRDEGRSMLFAGDHVLPTITPSIGFEPVNAPLPLAAYLRSLHLVRALPDTRLLPAHGSVTASVHARVDELVDHHAVRLEAAIQAVKQGASTGLEVAQQLRWTRHERRLDELDPFNQMLAILETGYHLDLLVERGALTCTLEQDVALYALG